MNTIVTHCSVDLDALASSWLVRRFLPGWQDAELIFVPAGKTFRDMPPDDDQSIIHVDTGLGKFDHHQKNDYTSATKKVFEYLKYEGHVSQKLQKPLEHMVNVITDIDHFAEADYPDAPNDRYDFMLSQIIEGLKSPLKEDAKIADIVFILLDALLHVFKNKVKAEEAIEKGFVFKTKWGKSIAFESQTEEATKLALKQGFHLVIKRSPERGSMRIKTLPKKSLDLTPLYHAILEKDKKGTWFLHVSKNILLNGSSKNPNLVPTHLGLKKLIEIAQNI